MSCRHPAGLGCADLLFAVCCCAALRKGLKPHNWMLSGVQLTAETALKRGGHHNSRHQVSMGTSDSQDCHTVTHSLLCQAVFPAGTASPPVGCQGHVLPSSLLCVCSRPTHHHSGPALCAAQAQQLHLADARMMPSHC